jgi:hypothetical protein
MQHQSPIHKLPLFFFSNELVPFKIKKSFGSWYFFPIHKCAWSTYMLSAIFYLCCNIPMTKRNISCFLSIPSSFFSNELIHPQKFLFHGFILLMAILFFSRLNFVLNQSSCVSQGCNNRNKAQFMNYPCLFFQMNLFVPLFYFIFWVHGFLLCMIVHAQIKRFQSSFMCVVTF